MTNWNLSSCSFPRMLVYEDACAPFLAFSSPSLPKFFRPRNTAHLSQPPQKHIEPNTVLHICTQDIQGKNLYGPNVKYLFLKNPLSWDLWLTTQQFHECCTGTVPGWRRPDLGAEGQTALRDIAANLGRLVCFTGFSLIYFRVAKMWMSPVLS